MKAILKPHPDLDFFIGFFGGREIPTKQDKFKPLVGYEVTLVDDGQKTKMDEYDIYIKKRSKNNVRDFEKDLRKQIRGNLKEEHPYKRDIQLEMIISISMDKKRLKEVDVDNLTKSIMDCFTGLVFEDDSQVVNVFASKMVHPSHPLNGFLIGIRKLDGHKTSWFDSIRLAYFEYEENDEK